MARKKGHLRDSRTALLDAAWDIFSLDQWYTKILPLMKMFAIREVNLDNSLGPEKWNRSCSKPNLRAEIDSESLNR